MRGEMLVEVCDASTALLLNRIAWLSCAHNTALRFMTEHHVVGVGGMHSFVLCTMLPRDLRKGLNLELRSALFGSWRRTTNFFSYQVGSLATSTHADLLLRLIESASSLKLDVSEGRDENDATSCASFCTFCASHVVQMLCR